MWRAEKMASIIYRASSSNASSTVQTEDECAVCYTTEDILARCRECASVKTCSDCHEQIMKNTQRCPGCRSLYGVFTSDSDRHDPNIKVIVRSSFQTQAPADDSDFKRYVFSRNVFYMNLKKTIINDMTTEQKTSMNRDLHLYINDEKYTAFDLVIHLAQRYAIDIVETYDSTTDTGVFQITITKRQDTQLDIAITTTTADLSSYTDENKSLYKSYLNDGDAQPSPAKVARREAPQGVLRHSTMTNSQNSGNGRTLDFDDF